MDIRWRVGGGERRRGGSSPVLLTEKWPTWSSHSVPDVDKKKRKNLTHISLRIGREYHVPDSSNHSLSLMKLLSSSDPEGNCGWNQL